MMQYDDVFISIVRVVTQQTYLRSKMINNNDKKHGILLTTKNIII